jgi:hypothetical protein
MLFHAPTLGHRAFGQASGAEAGARARGKAKHLAAQAEQPGVGIHVGKWWFNGI